ncbi:TRAP transporter large permease subunit, partial [Enterococcus avium]
VIMLIIGCAAPFGWLLAINNVPNIITEAILGLSTNPVVIMALITVLLLFLGTFMETISIIVLLTPMLLPVVTKLGFSPVHFGVILILNLAIGGTTPPLAVCLFTACRILGIQIDETFPDILYIVGTLILCLILIIVFPAITVGLPNLLIGS